MSGHGSANAHGCCSDEGHDHWHGDGCHSDHGYADSNDRNCSGEGHNHRHGGGCHSDHGYAGSDDRNCRDEGHNHRHDGCCHDEHECSHSHHHEHGHGHSHEHGEGELGKTKARLIISGVLFVVLLLLEHIVRLPILENRTVNTICWLVPYLVAGSDIIREAVEGVFKGELLGEAFLMTVASLGAFAVGENTEAAAVLILYSLGELLQDLAVGKSRSSIKNLMDIAPEYANLVTDTANPEGLFTAQAGSAYTRVKPETLAAGDVVAVLPGERIPVDGSVLSGSSMIDTSSMTGESVPRSVKEGDAVISGCINGNGLLTVRADREYKNSTVARVIELTEEASDRKSSTEKFITKFARAYTPAVVGAALLLAVVPPAATGAPFLVWLKRACTFLVISCPCALVISIPLSFFGGIGAASRRGILVKGSNFLEALTRVKIFASDKTGTLTKGEFKVNRLILPGGGPVDVSDLMTENKRADDDNDSLKARELLLAAAAAEYHSDHPIAESIKAAAGVFAGAALIPSESEAVPGSGVKAYFPEGFTVLAGNEKLMKEHGIAVGPSSEPGTAVYAARFSGNSVSGGSREGGLFLGTIIISDSIKPEAYDAIATLRDEGVREAVLLTGDSEAAAESVKTSLGLDRVFYSLLPQDKVEKVEELIGSLSKDEKLLYAGDGINDAPVLARSDIGVAMGSLGSDAAIEAADIVVMDDDINKIPLAVRIAKGTLHIARQNIAFALGIKAVFLLLGAFGAAGMWMAVFADVGVALICVLNSMRMLYKKV